MSLTSKINEEIKAAMKARNQERLAALRGIKSALLLAATEAGAGGEVDEATEMKIIQKLHKQRVDSAALYQEQGREDLQAEEVGQAKVLEEFLPEQMSEEELKKVVAGIVEKVGASSMADMGKVMGMATKELAGKADGKAISAVVRGLLS